MVCGELRIVPVEMYGNEKKSWKDTRKMNGKKVKRKRIERTEIIFLLGSQSVKRINGEEKKRMNY